MKTRRAQARGPRSLRIDDDDDDNEGDMINDSDQGDTPRRRYTECASWNEGYKRRKSRRLLAGSSVINFAPTPSYSHSFSRPDLPSFHRGFYHKSTMVMNSRARVVIKSEVLYVDIHACIHHIVSSVSASVKGTRQIALLRTTPKSKQTLLF